MDRKIIRRPPPKLESTRLKEYLATSKTESRLLGPLDRHIMLKADASHRRTDVLHPSEIVKPDWCHRASYHLLCGATKPPEVKRLRSENVFTTGHEVHVKYQKWLYEMGALVGEFRCRSCGLRWWTQSPQSCGNCPSLSLVYDEVPVASTEHCIQGKADGWVRGLGADFLLEIKTIGPGTLRMEQPQLLIDHDGDVIKAWRDIKRPFLNHRRQAGLYVELLHRTEQDAPSDIVFLYELKATNETKEFVVRRRPELVADVFEAALDVVYAVQHAQPPACSVNGRALCAKCRPFEQVCA